MDQSILLPLLPVAFMFLFVVMYFILYANFLQKLCAGKWHCGHRRGLPPCANSLWPRRATSSADLDETYIQLKGQITRIALAEAEALRLAKMLSENNEGDAKEYVANLRLTMYPSGMYDGVVCDQNSSTNGNNGQKAFSELPPPNYEDCV